MGHCLTENNTPSHTSSRVCTYTCHFPPLDEVRPGLRFINNALPLSPQPLPTVRPHICCGPWPRPPVPFRSATKLR